jgi:hypothetical protein
MAARRPILCSEVKQERIGFGHVHDGLQVCLGDPFGMPLG